MHYDNTQVHGQQWTRSRGNQADGGGRKVNDHIIIIIIKIIQIRNNRKRIKVKLINLLIRYKPEVDVSEVFVHKKVGDGYYKYHYHYHGSYLYQI